MQKLNSGTLFNPQRSWEEFKLRFFDHPSVSNKSVKSLALNLLVEDAEKLVEENYLISEAFS